MGHKGASYVSRKVRPHSFEFLIKIMRPIRKLLGILYRRVILDDAQEPSKLEDNILPRAVSLASALLLALDILRRYFELFTVKGLLNKVHHLLFIISSASLIYIVVKVRAISSTLITSERYERYEFVYPKNWRLLAKFSFVLLLAIYVAGFWSMRQNSLKMVVATVQTEGDKEPTVVAQESGDEEQTEEAETTAADDKSEVLFQRVGNTRLAVFDLVVQNTGTSPVILTHVGVLNRHPKDNTECAGSGDDEDIGGHIIPLVAKYVVSFSLQSPQTWKPLNPPLYIRADGVVRFSVSTLPLAAAPYEPCGDWSTQVAVAVKSSAGDVVQSEFHQIDSKNYYKQLSKTNELLNIIFNSHDEETKRIALDRLESSAQNDRKLLRVLEKVLRSARTEELKLSALGRLWRMSKYIQERIELHERNELKDDSSSVEADRRLADEVAESLRKIALSHEQPSVRIAAIGSLGTMGSDKALNILQQMLTTEKNSSVRLKVAQALEEVKQRRNKRPT